MSAYETVFECPAYKLVRKGYYQFRDGDKIAIPYQSARHGTLHHFFQLGSVAGYAVQNGDDVEAVLERARSFGHEMYYAFGLATVLTAAPRPQEIAAHVEYGEIIKAFGRFFRLDKAPNNNVHLAEVEMTQQEYVDMIVEKVAA